MSDRRREEPDAGIRRPVPRDLPDQQAGGTGEDDPWDTEIPQAPEFPGTRRDDRDDDETAPQEPAD